MSPIACDYDVKVISEIGDVLFDRIDFIEKACFRDESRFSTEEIPDIVRMSPCRLGAFVGDEMVGYSLARNAFGVGYLYSNAVLPEYRGRGIGIKMVQTRVSRLETIGCRLIQAHTTLDNRASAYVLKKCGFIPVQYVPDFYRDNVDAILWSRS
jgi:ribosomal protein S18 acetylase RimI-like enzyme